jgi:GDP/UDP-N,N'-diacetylbacillosamine 2-epimerase (hydrolysing)
MKHVNVLIGNSSSGIIEAPSLNTPSIDIGERQKGRIKADSIINCNPNKKSIIEAIQKGVSETFLSDKRIFINPYEKRGTSEEIISIIKHIDMRNIIKKRFYNIPI